MLQIGISLSASLTAGQLKPQDTAIMKSQACRLPEPLWGTRGSERGDCIWLARTAKLREGWSRAPTQASWVGRGRLKWGLVRPASTLARNLSARQAHAAGQSNAGGCRCGPRAVGRRRARGQAQRAFAGRASLAGAVPARGAASRAAR